MSPPDAPAVLRSDRPDLEVRRLLWQLALWPRRWRGAHALAEVRRDWQLAVKAFGSRPPVESIDVRTVEAPGGPVTLRIYTPTTGSAPRALLTRERIDWIRSLLSRVSDLGAPGVSPLDIPDLRGVAPAVVVTAGFDALRDEGLAYVRRLREAGVAVELLHYPGQIHGFMSFDRVLVGGRDAGERVGSLVAAAFDGGLVESSVGEVTVPWPRGWQSMPWLHPGQRWRETRVACIVARDQVKRYMRSVDVSGNVRAN